MRPGCCDFDCDLNFKCIDCPSDSGSFEISFQPIQATRKKRAFTCDDWTEWMDLGPPTGTTFAGKTVTGGDFIPIDELRKSNTFCDDSKIVAIDCRVKKTLIDWRYSSDEGLTCDLNYGFKCSNRRQAGKCQDYEIRLYCVCDETSTFSPGVVNSTDLSTVYPAHRQSHYNALHSPSTCTPGWTTWFDKSSGNEFTMNLKTLLGSCTNPVGLKCAIDDERLVRDLDQSGYLPEYTCDLDTGSTCDQKAPCKPCLNTKVQFWCPCSDEDTWAGIVKPTPISLQTTTVNPDHLVSCCSDMYCTQQVTCRGSCWKASSMVIDKKGLINNRIDEFGCMETTCSDQYRKFECYSMDPRQSQFLCASCCGGVELLNGSNYETCNRVNQHEYEFVMKRQLDLKIIEMYGSSVNIGFSIFVLLINWI